MDKTPDLRNSFDPRGLATAFVWLTRLPLGGFMGTPPPPLAAAVWAFPLVGLVVGTGGGLVVLGGSLLGLPDFAIAVLAVAACIMLTGAMHEDGLADLADAAGGRDRNERLAIMRDSRIGSYGVLALGLVSALRITSLAALVHSTPWLGFAGLTGAAALSRAAMALGMWHLPPARCDGLGRMAGRPTMVGGGLALLLGAAILCWPCLMMSRPLMAWLTTIGVAAIPVIWIMRRAQRQLGGQTGDVLGAMQQTCECAVLMTLVAFT